MFEIPIALFIFRRPEKASLIIDRISEIKPKKLYLIGDGPRNDNEIDDIIKCRQEVENHVVWDCEIIRDYASLNRGVFENIAGGVKRVFEKESVAIFLEDDNLPALSFFPFCKELLERYRTDDKVIWIMGSNYLGKCDFPDSASYAFTQNMLPCGWASWSDKFNKYYKYSFDGINDYATKNTIAKLRYSKALKAQEKASWRSEIYYKTQTGKYRSWDHQMSFSLRSQNKYGIIPKYNQIKNIGVDELSIHGGNTLSNKMTERFCENDTFELEFPLIHPVACSLIPDFEKKLGKVILLPVEHRIKGLITKIIKKTFKMNEFESIRGIFKS